MRPKKMERDRSGDLFRARLDQIIDMGHELVRLADEIDWGWLGGAQGDDRTVHTLFRTWPQRGRGGSLFDRTRGIRRLHSRVIAPPMSASQVRWRASRSD